MIIVAVYTVNGDRGEGAEAVGICGLFRVSNFIRGSMKASYESIHYLRIAGNTRALVDVRSSRHNTPYIS